MSKHIVSPHGYLLIDEQSVPALLKELGGNLPAGARFVADFVAAWPARVARLVEAAHRNDVDEAITVLLSIRTAGAMVGATELCSEAAELQHRLTQTRRVDGFAVQRLVSLGSPTCDELTDLVNRLETLSS